MSIWLRTNKIGITCLDGWRILSAQRRCRQRRWSCRFCARGSGSGTDKHETCWDSWCTAEFSSSSLWPRIRDKTQETWDTTPKEREDTGNIPLKNRQENPFENLRIIHNAFHIFLKKHPIGLLHHDNKLDQLHGLAA